MQTLGYRGHEELYEARVSRTVLWEPGGEVPPGDSTVKFQLGLDC